MWFYTRLSVTIRLVGGLPGLFWRNGTFSTRSHERVLSYVIIIPEHVHEGGVLREAWI